MRGGLILLLTLLAGPVLAQEAPDPMAGMDHMQMDHGAMDHANMAMAPVAGMAGVSGSLGFHPYEREAASGTAWQPDSTPRAGVRAVAGDWLAIGSLDVQAGTGGVWSGAAIASIRRDFDNADALQARLRLTPGSQAPVLSELAASYAHRLAITDTVFGYAAIVGQPAFGPSQAQDRLSRGGTMATPLGPQIAASAGVLTAGWSHGAVRIEASAFNGATPRPDQVATPRLDAWSARLSFNPARDWSLQASFAGGARSDLASVSGLYTRPLGDAGWWSATAGLGWGAGKGGALLEAAVSPDGAWTLFGRAERLDRAQRVSLGAERDLRISAHTAVGIGGEYAFAEDAPGRGGVGFVRLRVR